MPETNPAIFLWDGPMGLPRFADINSIDYAAAFDEALAADRAETDAVANNQEPASFENTIVALEKSGDQLNRVSALFWNLSGSTSDDELRALERDIAPKTSRHMSQTAANKALFSRIDSLWQNRADLELTVEQERVLERSWKGFVKGGAALEDQAQKQLAKINARLAELGTGFSQNILADEKDWFLLLDDGDDLTGIPDFLKSAMQSAANERGEEGRYAVTLSRSIIEPFLSFSDRRDLREKSFTAWQARGEHDGAKDNRPLVAQIVALRDEKAKLLGYKNFAELKLEDQMAKTPAAVNELLEAVWEKALAKAGREEKELSSLAAKEGANHDIKPWDWRYYSEKLRREKFDFDEAELKPYLELDAIIKAAFDVANKLFGISFKEHDDVKTYHGDARVFEVLNGDGTHRAVFIGDYFARSSKRSGAWMSGFQSQHKLDDGQTPIIVNVMNFAKAPNGEKTLLSMDEARTLFHEFGHALHGILSNVTYPSVAGTAVARDFVELPSQLYEHWLTVPSVLGEHARHQKTGETIPAKLLNKVLAATIFNAGFYAVEFTASALVDMAFHTAKKIPQDVAQFERDTLIKIKMPDAIAMRHRTPHFAHVFSGDGYSAGYYSYMWSEVLDADAFAAFEETGDVFDVDMAKKLHDHIYSAGGSVDPKITYHNFRGKLPSVDAMIEKRGLN